MPRPSSIVLAFVASALVGFAVRHAVPAARACAAPIDTGATFNLVLGVLVPNGPPRPITPEAEAAEQALWPETATLSVPERRIELPDGSALEFR